MNWKFTLTGAAGLMTAVVLAELADPLLAASAIVSGVSTFQTPAPAPAPQPVQLSGLLARPLFARDRRPATAPAGPATGDGGVPRLSGIILSGADRRAMFLEPRPDRPDHSTVVHEGDWIGSYRVQRIDASHVLLAGPDGLHMVQPRPLNSAPVLSASLGVISGQSAMPLPPASLDPARFDAPAGPFGISMYRFSPAHSHQTTQIEPSLVNFP